jgi:hypothetical protein
MQAVIVRIQILCWSYKHSVLSIWWPTLFRIRINEIIIIQILSYTIIIYYTLYYHYCFDINSVYL